MTEDIAVFSYKIAIVLKKIYIDFPPCSILFCQVHYKYPEIFFFSLLPYYDYDIYSQGVAAIETVPGKPFLSYKIC